MRPPHPRGKSPVPLPGVEPGPRPSEGRVPSVTRPGRDRSRRPGSNRHEPAYKAGASPFGHVGGSRGARSRTLSARFGGSLLSQEHTPENGPARSRCGGIVVHQARRRADSTAFAAPRCDPPFHHRGQERKARDSNPHPPRGETALAGRLGQPYPTTFRSSGPTGSRTRIPATPGRCRPVGP